METSIIYIIIGAIGGLLVGLIGGGIGPIVVPTLIPLLIAKGIHYDTAVHLAVGTSLCVILISTSISIMGYHFGKLIYWPMLKTLLPGTILGAMLGSSTAALLSGKILQTIFAVFLMLVSFYILKTRNNEQIVYSKTHLPTPIKLIFISSILSVCSTILGVSDGLLLVPFLRRYKLPMRNTIAIATVCAFAASLTGVIPYLLIGLHDPYLPVHAFSYVYIPAFMIIALASCLLTPVGVFLNKALPENKLKSIFALFLFFVGLKMLVV